MNELQPLHYDPIEGIEARDIKKPYQGSHSSLAGLGVLRSEQPPADPADILRRIVAWRDNVHAGRIVNGAELEALIEEGRRALGVALPDGGQR